VTRTLAIIPAVVVILAAGERGVLPTVDPQSVILSLQLSFAVVPLVRFTSSKQKMGPFVNRWWLQLLAWAVTIIIMALNGKLVYEQVGDWILAAGDWGWLVGLACVPVSLGLAALLLWMVFRREKPPREASAVSAEKVADHAAHAQRRFRRIGVALDALPSDGAMLGRGRRPGRHSSGRTGPVARRRRGGRHVVRRSNGRLGEPRRRRYLKTLAARLRKDLQGQGVPAHRHRAGATGDASTEIVNITATKGSSDGARRPRTPRTVGSGHGETITAVRHGLSIPVVAVKGK